MKKKFMMLVVSSFLIMFMTGCKKTYLSCSKVVSDTEDLKIYETIKLGYKRTELVDSNIYYDYKFKNDNVDIRTLKTAMELECEGYEGKKGVMCTVREEDDELHFELILDVKKLNDSTKELFPEMLEYGSYMDSKEKLSKEYTCK